MNKTRKIPLTRNKVTLVDERDFKDLNQFKWSVNLSRKMWYATRRAKGPDGMWNIQVMMHHQIIGKPKKGLEVDHINGNSLDNRRKNLRICTKSENQWNRKINNNSTTRVKGVHQIKKTGKFQARAQVHGKRINLGFFDSKKDAGRAYRVFAVKNFKEFARIK